MDAVNLHIVFHIAKYIFLLTAVKFVVNSCLLQSDIIGHITGTKVRDKTIVFWVGCRLWQGPNE